MPSPEDVAARLREAVGWPLDTWRELYESFSPVDVETGERRPRVPPAGADSRRAAVLVPVLLEPEGARLVYTVRRGDLQDHAGQISFPGGGMDPADGSLRETALREAEEEIDLLPPEAEMVLAPDEVEAIFTVSLDELMAPETFRRVLWRRDGRDYMVPIFAVPGPPRREIWGATAAMTASLLVRLGWQGGRAR